MPRVLAERAKERACSIKTTQHHGPECDEDEEEDEQYPRQDRVSSSAHAVFLQKF